MRFITLIEAGLTNDALDRDIWRYCQSHSFLLLTANRNQDDPDSLEQTLRDENREDAQPVVTISDPQRLIEPVYRERCIHALIGIILDLNNYLGRAMQFSIFPLSLAREARSALRPRSGAREGEGEGRAPRQHTPSPSRGRGNSKKSEN